MFPPGACRFSCWSQSQNRPGQSRRFHEISPYTKGCKDSLACGYQGASVDGRVIRLEIELLLHYDVALSSIEIRIETYPKRGRAISPWNPSPISFIQTASSCNSGIT